MWAAGLTSWTLHLPLFQAVAATVPRSTSDCPPVQFELLADGDGYQRGLAIRCYTRIESMIPGVALAPTKSATTGAHSMSTLAYSRQSGSVAMVLGSLPACILFAEALPARGPEPTGAAPPDSQARRPAFAALVLMFMNAVTYRTTPSREHDSRSRDRNRSRNSDLRSFCGPALEVRLRYRPRYRYRFRSTSTLFGAELRAQIRQCIYEIAYLSRRGGGFGCDFPCHGEFLFSQQVAPLCSHPAVLRTRL